MNTAKYLSHVRYRSEVKGRDGSLYTCDICSQAELTTQYIKMSADALSISRSSDDKLDPVVCGKATIHILSDEDRRYIDLYSVSGYDVILVVWRDGKLFWSGTIDPELYQEPFNRKKNYFVDLTFNDLSMLKRCKFDMKGVKSIKDVIQYLVSQAHAGREWLKSMPLPKIEYHVSTEARTSLHGEPGEWIHKANTLSALCVDTLNFYDGEAMVSYDVLEFILKSFRLRIEQRNGVYHVYDINSLCDATRYPYIVKSDDAELMADKVYNNITLTVKMNELSEMYPGVSVKVKKPSTTWRFPRLDTKEFDAYEMLFASDTSAKIIPYPNVDEAPLLFETKPVTVGTNESGVAMWAAPIPLDERFPNNYREMPPVFDQKLKLFQRIVNPTHKKYNPQGLVFTGADIAMQSDKIKLPTITRELKSQYMMALSVELFLSYQYTMYQAQNSKNTPKWDDNIKNLKLDSVLLYADIVAYDSENKATHKLVTEYDYNSGQDILDILKDGFDMINVWKPYTNNEEHVLIRYGNPGDVPLNSWIKPNHRTTLGGVGEATNAVNLYDNRLVFPFPPNSAYIVVKVFRRLEVRVADKKGDVEMRSGARALTYILVRGMGVDVVKQDGTSRDNEDVALKAWLNKEAHEELQQDVMLTSDKGAMPTSLALLRSPMGERIYHNMRSNGIEGTLEELYLNTAYSAYARRHNVIEGTFSPLPGYGAVEIDGKPHMVIEEEHNVRANKARQTLVEINKDEYAPNRVGEDE